MIKFYHLFPFASVPPGSRLVLYGAGEVGQWYLSQLKETGYAEVVAIADRDWERYQDFDVPLIEPKALADAACDYIVVSVEKRSTAEAIAKSLAHEFGVPAKKIVLGCESLCEAPLFKKPGSSVKAIKARNLRGDSELRFAFLFEHGYGLGDAIIMRGALQAIIKLAPEAVFDLFCAGDREKCYADTFYGQDASCGEILPLREYQARSGTYSLVLKGIRQLEIERLDEAVLSGFPHMLTVLRQIQKSNLLACHPWNSVVLRNYALSHVLGWDCYGCLGGGALDVQAVGLPLWVEAEARFQDLCLGKYLTCHSGSGGSEECQIKEWPPEYMEKYIERVKQEMPDLQVVQLAAADDIHLQGADYIFQGEDLRLVGQILAHSLLHVGSEGGLIHMATQLGTRCAVIFGPTDSAHFGYSGNIAISAGICAPCYGVTLDKQHCLRGEKRQPCMYGVTPEMVWERTAAYLRNAIHL